MHWEFDIIVPMEQSDFPFLDSSSLPPPTPDFKQPRAWEWEDKDTNMDKAVFPLTEIGVQNKLEVGKWVWGKEPFFMKLQTLRQVSSPHVWDVWKYVGCEVSGETRAAEYDYGQDYNSLTSKIRVLQSTSI